MSKVLEPRQIPKNTFLVDILNRPAQDQNLVELDVKGAFDLLLGHVRVRRLQVRREQVQKVYLAILWNRLVEIVVGPWLVMITWFPDWTTILQYKTPFLLSPSDWPIVPKS